MAIRVSQCFPKPKSFPWEITENGFRYLNNEISIYVSIFVLKYVLSKWNTFLCQSDLPNSLLNKSCWCKHLNTQFCIFTQFTAIWHWNDGTQGQVAVSVCGCLCERGIKPIHCLYIVLFRLSNCVQFISQCTFSLFRDVLQSHRHCGVYCRWLSLWVICDSQLLARSIYFS